MTTYNTSNFLFLIAAFSAILLNGAHSVTAQSYTALVVDAQTEEPIPFATVQFSENSGTITNGEGIVAIDMEQVVTFKDSVHIWSMGYEKVSIYPKKAGDTIIKLKEEINMLGNTFLTNNPLDSEEVIARVKENLSTNYPNTLTQKKIFFRQSVSNKMSKMDIEVEKTTIPEFSQAFMDSLVRAIPKNSDSYSESVGILSGNYNKQKLSIEKAAKLYDESKEGMGVKDFGKRLEDIVQKNVKPDSYYKIKSGIIGTKIELDSTEIGNSSNGVTMDVDTKGDPKKKDVTLGVKENLNKLYESMFFQEDTKLDFLTKSNRYEFTQREITTIGDAIVYVIDFEPKWKKDFKGTLYINTDDFAIMRLEYENVRKLSSFGMFGISYRKFLYKGKSIYGKDENGGYTLRYMELENGTKFALDRPLKIIEKNKNVKGRRKQNEVAMEIEIANTEYTKKEFVVYSSAVIDETTYEATTESTDVEAKTLSAYDPDFWKGYTIMEPNKAIQNFTSGAGE